jgi:hypothetical protein
MEQKKSRNRMKQTKSLLERLAEFASGARREAEGLPNGRERDELLKKVRQAERASEIEGWAKSPEPPQPATAATSKAE